MKKNITILLIVLVIFAGKAYAQQKYGHINSDNILQLMPEYKDLTAAVDKKKKDDQDKMEKMYEDYQAKQKELNDYGESMMQAVREEKARELDSLQQTITVFQNNAQADLQDFQNKLMKPLNDKYLKTVKAVAKENGYTYIFDVASGLLAYYPEKTGDVTELVEKKMGIFK